LQIDSVNILSRAHLLPVQARLGNYDTALLARAISKEPRQLVEAWAHEASFVTPETYHQLEWWRREVRASARCAGFYREQAQQISEILHVVKDLGPVTAREVGAALGHSPVGGGWWNDSTVTRLLRVMFLTGDVASAERTSTFERRYDLPERVIPPAVRSYDDEEAQRELVRKASIAHGIASETCLADYYRLKPKHIRKAISDLVSEGELIPVQVSGWCNAYLHHASVVPKRITARALLAPFDPLVFERKRLHSLWGMHYRIGIYTPAALRTHGYYVLPFLLGEHLVARVDLKADRKAGVLVVKEAHLEPAQPGVRKWSTPDEIAKSLNDELEVMREWLGLDRVEVLEGVRGDLYSMTTGKTLD
jgi:uncharacterized protein YcaQ